MDSVDGLVPQLCRHQGSNNFLVKSERLLRLCVDDSELEANATEMDRLKVQFVRDLLGTAGSQSSVAATNNLLLGMLCWWHGGG